LYNIGDKVVYPMHGAGVIESIEEKKFLSEKQKYYIMRMPIGDMKVMIPINNTVEIGIRDVIESETAKGVLTSFNEMTIDMSVNWNKRYRENMLKLKSGAILDVAYVVKSLMLREKIRGLSTGERKMLSNAKQILVSELVLAQVSESEEILDYLNDVIETQLTDTTQVEGDVVVAEIVELDTKVSIPETIAEVEETESVVALETADK